MRAVLDYVHRTMSRFLYEEDLYKVIEAVKEWSNDTNYTPTKINRFKETVENIPLRHFVWNIAERLGKRDYTMAMRIGMCLIDRQKVEVAEEFFRKHGAAFSFHHWRVMLLTLSALRVLSMSSLLPWFL